SNRFSSLEPKVGRKHRKPAQNSSLLAAQQIVTPVNGGHQGLLPRHSGPAASSEQRETVAQPVDQLLQSDRPQPDGCELQRQRHAVEMATEIGNKLAGCIGFLELDARVRGSSY